MRVLESALDTRKTTGKKIVPFILAFVLVFSFLISPMCAFANETELQVNGNLVSQEMSTDDTIAPNDEGATGAATIKDETSSLVSTEGTEIVDDENPLAAFDAEQCWVHILMIMGIVCTVVYGGAVVARRLGHARKIDKFDNNITGTIDNTQTAPRTQRVANHA